LAGAGGGDLLRAVAAASIFGEEQAIEVTAAVPWRLAR